MSIVAAVFPGQGAQRKGMASDFHERFPEARHVFEVASDALSFNVAEICHRDDPRLDMTEFTQPCILTAEIAMLESLKKHFGFKPEYFGGHSLGEYAALVAAGAIPFDIAVRLVHIRGKLMQSSAPLGMGGMAAVIMENLPRDEIIKETEKAGVDIANDNSPMQIVISGEKNKVDALCLALSTKYSDRGIRVVPLVVSAPFHSRHMKEVEKKFGNVLKEHGDSFAADKAACVTSNFTGTFHKGSHEDIVDALTRQISGRVRWRDNMAAIMDKSKNIFEIGPNRPLGGFFKACGILVQSIIDVRSAERALSKATV